MEFKELFDGSIEMSPQADLAQATLEMPAAPGVCLFATKEDKPVLLLSGANLRSLARRRLTEEPEGEVTKRTKLRPIVRRIWFRTCHSPFETHLAYFRTAHTLYPDTYQDLFPRLDAWLVHVDPAAQIPIFSRTKEFKPGAGLFWGPYADGKTAARCVEVLQDVFDLCRSPDVLADAPRAAACSYAQMGRCAAVCDGTVAVQDYRKIIDRAIDFLNHPIQKSIEKLQQQMKAHSAALEFEQAQRLKQKIDQAKSLQSPACRWAVPLDEFFVLAFQPGPLVKLPDQRKRQPTVTPFLMGPGWVDQIESFTLGQAEDGCRALLDHINLALFQDRTRDYGPFQQSLFAWTAHLLYRKNPFDKGMYLRYEENLTAVKLAQQVISHFTKKQQTHAPAKKPALDAYSITAQSDPELGMLCIPNE